MRMICKREGFELGRRMVAIGALLSLALPAVAWCGGTLLWEESLDNLSVTAANSVGLAPTVVTTEAAFVTAFGGGSFDLVIIDQPSNGIAAATATSLSTYIAGGGRLFLSYWDMDGNFNATSAATLRPAFGVAAASEFTAALPVNVWVPGHPIFNNPNAIPAVIPTDGTDPWLDDGDRFTAAPGATALAGFTVAPAAGQAAILQANGGRTLINGFVSDEMDPTVMTNLLANQFVSLIPEPATGTVIGFACVLMMLRRR